TATAATNGTNVAANSIFEWIIGDGTDVIFTADYGTITQTNDYTSTITNAKPGVYTLRVTDEATGCDVIDKFTVEDLPVYPVISDATVVDQNLCDASGSITIEDAHLSFGTVADFTFTWYRESLSSTALVDVGGLQITGAELNSTISAAMGAGTYYVFATSGLECTSQQPYTIIVGEDIAEPEINFAQTANTSCDIEDGNANGVLTATAATTGTNVAANSIFEWFIGDGTDVIFTADYGTITQTNDYTSTITNAKPGVYTLRVTDEATGC